MLVVPSDGDDDTVSVESTNEEQEAMEDAYESEEESDGETSD